jgi:hypothetical protein
MSAILHGFSINTSGSPRRLAQRDTEAYWRRLLALGGTDINANDEVQNVQEFLAGVYQITSQNGANIWALRSSQNVGTGSTAIPLVGGSRATLINGPTWEANGIRSASGAARNLTASGVMQPAVFTLFAAINNQQVSPGAGVFQIAGNGTTSRFGIGHMSNGVQARFNSAGISGSVLNLMSGPATISLQCAEGAQRLQYQTTVNNRSGNFTSTGFTPGSADFIIAASNGSGTGHIEQPLAMLLSGTLAHADIFSVYKSTLGQGLGLP